MFVQVTQCKRRSSTYLTYLVRESFRTPQGPRSRTVCNILRALANSVARMPKAAGITIMAGPGRIIMAIPDGEECDADDCQLFIRFYRLHKRWTGFSFSLRFWHKATLG